MRAAPGDADAWVAVARCRAAQGDAEASLAASLEPAGAVNVSA